MPDPNTFDPVAEFKAAWPAAANMPEDTIRKNLQDPNLFRSAFPNYAHLDDKTISSNMKQYAPGGPAERTIAAARVAQPTQFEQESAARGDSATPWLDTLKGVGEGMLQPVSAAAGLINKIPKVGETLAPSQGVNALQQMTTPATPGEKLGAREANVASALIPVAEGAEEARAAGKLIPYAKRAVTGLVGSAVGGEAGKYGGRLIGGQTGGAIGEGIGTLAGGLAGGGAFGEKYRNIGNPSEIPVLGKLLPNLVEEPKETPFVPMGPTRVNPEHIWELNHPAPVPEAPPAMPTVGKPAPGRTGPPLQRLGDLIEQGAGTRPLEPNVPLRSQLPQSVGAASAGFTPAADPMQNAGGPITFRREPIVKTIPGLEEGVLRAKAPEKIPTLPPEEVGRQMGAPPLQQNVPLREQWKPTGEEPPSRQQTLEQKYPDREVRQMVHANGEKMIDAIGEDRETMKAVHDLKNSDVRQALINSGEDMGQMSIGNRKATGNQMTRQEAFERLLEKGYKAHQIVDLAKKPMEDIGGSKPGPIRSQPWTEREKTGD
jgi:hypothetical protein